MDPDLRNLRAFVAVADELSFTRAARALHLSQQGLTDRIHRLEQQIGAPLFERTTRRVELSGTGAGVIDDARALLAQVDETWRRMAAYATRARGTLTLGIGSALVYGMLPRLAAALEDLAPDVDLAPIEARMDDLVPMVLDGRVDAAVALHPPDVPELRAELLHLGSVELMIAESHPIASQPSVSPTQLRGMVALLPTREASPGLHEAVLEAFEAEGVELEVRALPRLRGYLPQALFDGTAFSVWATVAPRKYVRHGLVTIPFDGLRTQLETKLLYRPERERTALIGLLRDALDRVEPAA